MKTKEFYHTKFGGSSSPQSIDQSDEVCARTQKPDGPTRTRTPAQLINYLSLTNGTTAEEDQDY